MQIKSHQIIRRFVWHCARLMPFHMLRWTLLSHDAAVAVPKPPERGIHSLSQMRPAIIILSFHYILFRSILFRGESSLYVVAFVACYLFCTHYRSVIHNAQSNTKRREPDIHHYDDPEWMNFVRVRPNDINCSKHSKWRKKHASFPSLLSIWKFMQKNKRHEFVSIRRIHYADWCCENKITLAEHLFWEKQIERQIKIKIVSSFSCYFRCSKFHEFRFIAHFNPLMHIHTLT